jgi:membrane protein DedA with SNARE-associated domain
MEQLLATALDFLASHGYVVVFLWMFVDQAGLPVPSIPLLVAAGALSATGEIDLTGIIAAAAGATLLADALWFALGRYKGGPAISLVCRLALEPSSCVSTTRTAFGRFGPATLLIAKFLPGVQTLAPASAGFVQAPWLGFLLLDLLGTLLFVLPFVLGGYFFQPQLEALLDTLGAASGGIALLVAVVLGLYLAVKVAQWALFLREHRLLRLTPDELHARLQREDPVSVIDLRQRLDFDLLPRTIPGSLRIPIDEIKVRRGEIPLKHDVILVCT